MATPVSNSLLCAKSCDTLGLAERNEKHSPRICNDTAELFQDEKTMEAKKGEGQVG